MIVISSKLFHLESTTVVSPDYLEEEYVDLDWDEEDDYSSSSNEKPAAKVSKRTQTPLGTIGSITATSFDDQEEEVTDNADEDDDDGGSGHHHQIDDEDLEEGTSKNGVSWETEADAWISEGSGQKALGDFGMCLAKEITPKLFLTASL